MATETSQTVGVTGEDISAASPVLTPRVKVVEPRPSVLPDSGRAQALIDSHPAYRGYNPFAFREKIIQDDKFLDQYVQNIFESMTQAGNAPAWANDPEQVAERFRSIKSNIRNDLSKDMFTGEDVKGFVVNRELGAMRRETSPLPVGRMRESNDTLLDAVRWRESRNGKFLVSPVGALGEYQVMPGTAKDPGYGVKPLADPMDPVESRRFANDYLNAMLKKYNGDVRRALVAYNWGPGNADKWDGKTETLPKETREYLGEILPKLGVDQNKAPEPVRQNPKPTTYNDMQIESIVKSNPAMFAGLGISDEKGNLLYSPRVVAEKIGADPNLERGFVEAQYDMFQAQLTKSNNLYVNADDPDMMSKAWVAYSRFGPEALTQFINFTQGYSPDLTPEQQLPQVRNALLALKTVRKDGKNVMQEIDRWFTEGGPPEYTGLIRSAELFNPLPADLNGYSKYIHNYASPIQGLSTLITAMNPNQAGATNLAGEVLRDLEQGTLSRESKGFYLDVLRRAQKEDADFSMDDIFNTIIVNSTPVRGEDGRYRYRFNYENLPTQAKIAVNTLRATDNQYLNMVSQQSDGSYLFEPDRFDRLENKYKGWGRVMTETRALYNEDGTYAGMGEAPATGIVAQIVNGGSAFLFETGQFYLDYGLAPGLRATKAVADAFGWEQLAKATESGPAIDWMRDVQDKELINQVEGFLPKATVYTTEMGLYMAGLFATGGAASALAVRGATTAARLAESATVARQANQIYSAGRILGTGASTTRLGLQAQRLAQGVKNREAWTEAFLRVEAGGAIMELLGGQEKSIYNGGIVDDALSAISGGLIDMDTEKMYMASDRMTQFGVDALTGFALGNLIDNVWAGTKFGANVLTGRGGRGLAFDEAIGNFAKVDKPVFGPDYRRFFHNLNNNLQEMPIGSIEDTLVNMVNGRAVAYTAANIETVNDVAANFYHQTGEVYGTLMQDIKNSIKYYDNRFGNVPMSEDAINARAQQIYDNAFDNLAENMLGVMRGGNNSNANRFAWGFVDALDQQLPTVKAVQNVKDGIVEEQYSLATATRLRAESPGRVIKSRGDNLYTVYEAEPNLWAVDLSTRLRKGLTEQSQEQWVQSSMLRAGFDPKAPTDEGMKLMEQLEQLAGHMAGRPFLSRSGDKLSLGYIESYDGKSFYLRDSETGELRKMKDNEVLSFVARKGRPKPTPRVGRIPETGTQPPPPPVYEREGLTIEARTKEEYVDVLKQDTVRRVKSLDEEVIEAMERQNRQREAELENATTEEQFDEINERFDNTPIDMPTDEVLLDNITQLRRMGVTETEIYDAAFGDLYKQADELEEKLAKVEKKTYASEGAKKAQITKLENQLDDVLQQIEQAEVDLDFIIRQTDDRVDNRVVEKVKKTKKAAKVAKEMKNADSKLKDNPKC